MPDLRSRLARLVAELRRRRVFRVALIYLAVAWAAIQVTDTVQPRLALPDWAPTLVIVLAILGFPLAVGLAWAFDVDAGVIRRADAAAIDSTRPPRRARSRLIPWLGAGAIAVAAVVIAAVWPRATASAVDDRRIAVLPFDVAGAEPDLAYLGVGLMELVATGLRDSTATALPADAVALAMRQLGYDDLSAPSSGAAAADIARQAGARIALRGRVVGSRGGVVVNVDLIDVENPDEPVRFSTMLPPDDLHGIGEDIVVQAMAARGGVPSHSLSAVTTTSPEALQHYLRGVERERHGDYASALRQYANALVEDSTFAMAALGYMDLQGMTWVNVPQFAARRIAWKYRDRLSSSDRLYLEAIADTSATGWHDQIERIEDAVRSAEHDPRLWLQLGWLYATVGRSVGIVDAEERGIRALDRSYDLDPRTPAAADFLFSMAVRRRDLSAARRWHDVVVELDSMSRPTAASIRWTMAVLADDTAATRAVGYDRDADNILDLAWRTKAHQAHAAEAADELDRALARATGSERVQLGYNVAIQAMAEGRPSRLWAGMSDARRTSGYASDGLLLFFAHYWQADRARSAAELDRMMRTATSSDVPLERVTAACALSQYYADIGDPARTLAAVEPLRDTAGLATAWREGASLCVEAADAWVAHIRGEPDAADELAALELTMQEAARWNMHLLWNVIIPTQIISARIWEDRGELERARELYRRIALHRWPDLWVDRLAEEGRLSELLGDTAAAVHAYERYLVVRTRPEPPFDTLTERVADRLAALLAPSR